MISQPARLRTIRQSGMRMYGSSKRLHATDLLDVFGRFFLGDVEHVVDS